MTFQGFKVKLCLLLESLLFFFFYFVCFFKLFRNFLEKFFYFLLLKKVKPFFNRYIRLLWSTKLFREVILVKREKKILTKTIEYRHFSLTLPHLTVAWNSPETVKGDCSSSWLLLLQSGLGYVINVQDPTALS